MNVKYDSRISVEDYNYLRKSVGWAELDSQQALIGINNSTFVVSAIVDGQTIGATRVVGDGGYIAIIVDVIVLPEFRGRGVGKAMMQKALDFIKSSLSEGQFVFVNLMASRDKESFYAQFGFETRPNERFGAGMAQHVYCNDA